MRSCFLFIFLLVISLTVHAQVVLTLQNNGYVNGDSSRFSEVTFIDPGLPGADRIWDFSKVTRTGSRPFSLVSAHATRELDGLKEYNLVLNENGNEYFLSEKENDCEEFGFLNKETKMTMVYKDPIVKMKFPMKFGDTFEDAFSGVAYYNDRSRIDLAGQFFTGADAFGTLILPEKVLDNVLRVKTVRKVLQIGVCGSTISTVTKYFWYAPGFRYPVFTTREVEMVHGGDEPVISKSATENLDQLLPRGNSNVSATLGDTGEGISVMLFPNPFREQFTYNYFLRKSLGVSLELYDMTGNVRMKLISNQTETEGLHTGSFDGVRAGLTPGIYYVRFTFDKQVVVQKIVKI